MLQTSLTGCTTRKFVSCSRGMKNSVPATAPVAVSPDQPACSKLLARPKSAILTSPSSPPSSRFSGFRSRWTKPCGVRVRQARERLQRERPTASSTGNGFELRAFSTARTLPPEQYSIAK